MIRFLTNNLGWKLLSLLISALIWISVASEPELSTFLSVPVEYKNMPDDLEISSEIVESVYLEMRGPSGQLRELADAHSAVVMDLSNVHQPGERTFTVAQGNVILPRGIQLVHAIPSQLHFRFEHRVVRLIPVHVRFSSEPPKGYYLAESVAQPSALPIGGPESSMVKTQSVATDPLDLSAVVGAAQFRVNTFLPDPHEHFQSSSQVVVKVVVKKR